MSDLVERIMHESYWSYGFRQEICSALATARNDALEEAARVAEWAHMVPPDGGSPTADECEVAFEAARRIRAIKGSATRE